ncbi:MAG: NRDE family protein [Sediminibacterium sp.]
MCTVTFIPTSNGVYLTSNRDEKHTRSIAGHPVKYDVNGYQLLYPTDRDAGGSWIAAKDNGEAAVLLNGGFVNHVPEKKYRKSRGLVFLELIGATQPDQQFSSIDLAGIAPFTLVLFVAATLIECRWDGKEKHISALDHTVPHIWSSVTLYDIAARQERENWFKEWLANTPFINTQTIAGFHRCGGKGNSWNGLVLNRNNQLFTVSITSVFIKPGSAEMDYFDLRENTEYTESIHIAQRHLRVKESFITRCKDQLRRVFIITTNWEYWPFHVVYTPIYLYWFWLSLKARSFFFFSAANPSIENSGFTLERKSRIYDLMPSQYYPATILCCTGQPVSEIEMALTAATLKFPLIAKPDIGERGTKVKLIRSTEELKTYCQESKVDFLLQAYVSYDNEIGIFYYRIPGEKNGKISGIVGKEFLAVTGDGISTIEALIRKEKRFFLQLPVLTKEYGDQLQTVLPDGTSQELVPYGNHCRGAKFVDLSYRITGELTESIDRFCKQVPEFYFGRMDIKFSSWEELSQGKNFSVIELNGAGSEPTHMYDPSHSVFFAWKEIIRHWNLLYRISRINAKNKGLELMQTREGLRMLRDHTNYMKLVTVNK